MADIAREGFQMLDAISLAEIDKRIDYLEEALATYKMLRQVKVISEKIDIPQDFTPALPVAPAPAAQLAVWQDLSQPVLVRVRAFLLNQPGAVRVRDIALAVSAAKVTVSTKLAENKDTLFIKPRHGYWSALREGDNVSVVAEMQRQDLKQTDAA